MTTSFKHYILTRYNVATPGRWEEIRLRPNWLEKRYEMFRDYCVAGIASQTNKNFEWIIFFDAKTPDDYMARIEALRTQFPFRIVKTELFEMSEMCLQLSSERGSADWLLTTRLDSDDILATDYVERLHKAVRPGTAHNINFPNGLIMSIKDDRNALYRDRDESSPFASLCEPFTDSVQTIWARQHRHIDELAPIIQADEAPAWLQVVHGDNISNHVRGTRVRMKTYAEKFPYLKTLPALTQEQDMAIRFENWTATPLRYAKETSRNLIKKLIGRR